MRVVEKVTIVDIWVCQEGISERIVAGPCLRNSFASVKVNKGIFADLLLGCNGIRRIADGDIEDYICLVVDDLEALLDS